MGHDDLYILVHRYRAVPLMRQREPRLYDPKFLEFLRTCRCCCCGKYPPNEAAHIRMACPEIGKRETGMQEKPDDKFAVPLCSWCHRDGENAQHKTDEKVFWAMWEIDPFLIAAKFYAEYGGKGGRHRSPRKVKPRKPRAHRQKIKSRGFR